MATSPNPLVWDFNRQIGSDTSVLTGGVVHFYDETAQTIFLNSGIKTRLSEPLQGQWEAAELSFPSAFINETVYTRLNIDHPANGAVYGTAIEPDGALQFLRYQYAADISDIAEKVTFKQQIDSPITQMSASIMNIDKDFFTADGTLFNPGAKLTLKVALGDSEMYSVGVAFLDECPYDEAAKTVSLSGRNAIGYFLKDAMFGSSNTFTGTYPEVIGWIMGLAGVPVWESGTGTGSIEYTTIKPNDKMLDVVDWVNDIVYYSSTDPLRLIEMPDGTVYSGKLSIIAEKMPNGYYTFDEGADVFKRKTRKNADGVYSGVYATGKTLDNVDLTPVEVGIDNYTFWNIPPKKLLNLKSPEGWVATQPDLQWWAENEATKRQYSGITEEFDTPFRPQLLVGDVAEVNRDGVGVTLGVITEVDHTMGKKGYSTSFSCDSGGKITVTEDGLAVEVSGVYGYNRKQNLADLIRKVVAN